MSQKTGSGRRSPKKDSGESCEASGSARSRAALDPSSQEPPVPGEYGDVERLDLVREDNHRSIDEGDEAFEALLASISSVGVIEPVQIAFDAERRDYVMLSGHRRRRAVLALRKRGRETRMPCRLSILEPSLQSSRERAAAVAVVTNLMRAELSGVERARAIADFMEKSGQGTGETARALGMDRKTVERILNINLLPAALRSEIEAMRPQPGEKALARLAAAHKAMLKGGFSPEEAEAASREALGSSAAGPSPRGADRGEPKTAEKDVVRGPAHKSRTSGSERQTSKASARPTPKADQSAAPPAEETPSPRGTRRNAEASREQKLHDGKAPQGLRERLAAALAREGMAAEVVDRILAEVTASTTGG